MADRVRSIARQKRQTLYKLRSSMRARCGSARMPASTAPLQQRIMQILAPIEQSAKCRLTCCGQVTDLVGSSSPANVLASRSDARFVGIKRMAHGLQTTVACPSKAESGNQTRGFVVIETEEAPLDWTGEFQPFPYVA
ncbi:MULTISPECIES: hypothetical protein [unclassified Mesorhizobium]|uniref:hypothetical protein n=1 Tax=Mesorhizobium sp. B2-3-12 TaxID=2589952 RepID=UPI001FEE933A|nr:MULTISPECIES: hypothetical protein [unclassified Mesorhizobium]